MDYSRKLRDAKLDLKIINSKLTTVELQSEEHKRLLFQKKLKQQSIDFYLKKIGGK